ncbi:L-histidine N(alpha)-methyltransferase [Pseudarthrobacter enclensis]|uniref:L-histidine N-alpha-methyltransferase n=1 Tax=Pseudarthrobacter enclensis TaxID=993070 RepID=A0ABT9S0Z4_9MICC|nr:L-histidine N(alpha)-methyltransferase [Pseudarthrobacter enclensis]MDP9890154.1 L-histidine N-alpha-methyltransferase [Pseudarthrobacter enclensis]
MTTGSADSMDTIIRHLPQDHLARTLRADVRAGLGSRPRTLPPKWFYDEVGSELFDRITELPEYYPSRAEREALQEHAAHIAAAVPAGTLIELGSGSSRKTPLLLQALLDTGHLERYVAVDVSDTALAGARDGLAAIFPDLEQHALLADFETQLHVLPRHGHRLVAFLGGTIGNFEPHQRAAFLAKVRELLGSGGGSLLLGTDLVKAPSVLVPAYDDSAGVTAEFNRNVLRVLNNILDADFDVDAFEHVALWNAENEWIEMRLRAKHPMFVRLPGAGMDIHFEEGEELRTEISAKFRPQAVAAELAGAGFTLAGQWTDPQERFALTLGQAL